jgi:hypothetical protein
MNRQRIVEALFGFLSARGRRKVAPATKREAQEQASVAEPALLECFQPESNSSLVNPPEYAEGMSDWSKVEELIEAGVQHRRDGKLMYGSSLLRQAFVEIQSSKSPESCLNVLRNVMRKRGYSPATCNPAVEERIKQSIRKYNPILRQQAASLLGEGPKDSVEYSKALACCYRAHIENVLRSPNTARIEEQMLYLAFKVWNYEATQTIRNDGSPFRTQGRNTVPGSLR